MAEEHHEIRRINWTEAFGFTHIFKSFRMAIHPSKLLLAFAAIAIIFITGNVMDWAWSLAGQTVRPGEIRAYFASPPQQFDQAQQAWRENRLERAAALLAEQRQQTRNLTDFSRKLASNYLATEFRTALTEANRDAQPLPSESDTLLKARVDNDSWRSLLKAARGESNEETERIGGLLKKAYEAAEQRISGDQGPRGEQEREAAPEQLKTSRRAAEAGITERRLDFERKVRADTGEPIFSSWVQYELSSLHSAFAAVADWNILGGLDQYERTMREKAYTPASTADPYVAPIPSGDGPGFVFWMLVALHGFGWLITQHWVYAVIMLLVMLAVVAVFGGAVNRIAALHFAREEKISMPQALKFSLSKFFSFLTAPLLPLGMIFLLGLLQLAGGFLFGNIAGGIILGLLFFLALILGFIIAFLTIGLVAGVGLMYPTIAVESSDSFDAISRSLMYVFAKPWRAALYALVALVYGVVTYLFVRLFAYIALALTHWFVGGGIFANGHRLHATADKLDLIWTKPQFGSLFGPFNWAAMSGWEQVGAFLIGIWVFIVAGMVGAYILTYLASSTTVIYYLLRRAVDATDLDDVYVEEGEDVIAPVTAAEGPGATPPAEPPPAAPQV